MPYARDRSGIMIRGDAWTWWASAQGQYRQGRRPEVGAVMVFRRHGGMRRGHVAVVRQIIDRRTLAIDHANWQPSRSGNKGAVNRNVRVIDTSARNDWSSVRVWYGPTNSFGIRNYPVYGFIYPDGAAIRRAPQVPAQDIDMRMAALEAVGSEAGSASGSTDGPGQIVRASSLRLSRAPIVPRAKPGTADAAPNRGVQPVVLRTLGASTAEDPAAPAPRARPELFSTGVISNGTPAAAAQANRSEVPVARIMAPMPDGLPIVPRVRPGSEAVESSAVPVPRARPGQG